MDNILGWNHNLFRISKDDKEMRKCNSELSAKFSMPILGNNLFSNLKHIRHSSEKDIVIRFRFIR